MLALLVGFVAAQWIDVTEEINTTRTNSRCKSCDGPDKSVCTECISNNLKKGDECVHRVYDMCQTAVDGECTGCFIGRVFDPETKSCQKKGVNCCKEYADGVSVKCRQSGGAQRHGPV